MTTLDFESNYSYSDYTTKDYDVYLGGDGTTELKTQLSSNGNGFIGIGDAHLGKSFFGTFDGKENKIVNLYENTKGALFGSIQNSTIKNLKVYGTIVRDSQCAGIIIRAENSYIINCANYADIYGRDVAGICNDSISSYFYNCYNMGTVYNEKENSQKLNYWKIDQNSTYPVFEE